MEIINDIKRIGNKQRAVFIPKKFHKYFEIGAMVKVVLLEENPKIEIK